MTALRQVTLTAAGVMLAAGIYEVVRAFDPPAMWPFMLGMAGVSLIVAYAIENLGGA
jgi:hypothetical protein